jgi:hypothetical protein
MPQPESRKRFTFDRPGKYRIRVQGFLDDNWSDRLGGMSVTTRKQGDHKQVTTLVGIMLDQATLAGVLNTLPEPRNQKPEPLARRSKRRIQP